MFGKGLQKQMGGMPQDATQAPKADPMSQINQKLDQILALLQQDTQADATETGGVNNG